MNNILENKNEQKTIDLIINAAYGSANMFEKIKVWFLIRKNEELNLFYKEYKATADSIHSLPREVMPDYILERVEHSINNSIQVNENSFISDLLNIFLTRPQIVFVATAIVIGLMISSLFVKEQQFNNQYSQAEIELANKQAHEALLLVSKIFNSTHTTLTEEILPNRVVKPLNEGFGYVNDLFKKGDI
ncbi:MAG: hypothetical protein QY331_15595 [Melioribacteraceae bacterium]|nr:hypothetical protein [Melioribacteraceae bacterium]WKZ69386.1 MAG: hypothetical protein QY331_15595 [Melioribacteraceae bacterium]